MVATTKKVWAVASDPYNDRCYLFVSQHGLYTSQFKIEIHRGRDLQKGVQERSHFKSPIQSFLLQNFHQTDLFLDLRSCSLSYDYKHDQLLLWIKERMLIVWDVKSQTQLHCIDQESVLGVLQISQIIYFGQNQILALGEKSGQVSVYRFDLLKSDSDPSKISKLSLPKTSRVLGREIAFHHGHNTIFYLEGSEGNQGLIQSVCLSSPKVQLVTVSTSTQKSRGKPQIDSKGGSPVMNSRLQIVMDYLVAADSFGGVTIMKIGENLVEELISNKVYVKQFVSLDCLMLTPSILSIRLLSEDKNLHFFSFCAASKNPKLKSDYLINLSRRLELVDSEHGTETIFLPVSKLVLIGSFSRSQGIKFTQCQTNDFKSDAYFEELEPSCAEILDQSIQMDFQRAIFSDSKLDQKGESLSREDNHTNPQVQTRRCILFATNMGIFVFDKSSSKIYKIFCFQKNSGLKLSGASRVLHVKNCGNFYCISIKDAEKNYQVIVQINDSSFTVIKHRVLQNVSQCDFFGELPGDDKSTSLIVGPLISYLDISLRFVVIERAFTDLEMNEIHRNWFEIIHKKDNSSNHIAESTVQTQNLEPKSESNGEEEQRAIPQESQTPIDYRRELQLKQTVVSLRTTDFFGRSVILIKNVFNNLMLTQNPSTPEPETPFDLNLVQLPLRLKPHEEILSFQRVAESKYFCLVTTVRIWLVDGQTLRKIQEKKFPSVLTSVTNLVNSHLLILRFQHRYTILDLKHLSHPVELFYLSRDEQLLGFEFDRAYILTKAKLQQGESVTNNFHVRIFPFDSNNLLASYLVSNFEALVHSSEGKLIQDAVIGVFGEVHLGKLDRSIREQLLSKILISKSFGNLQTHQIRKLAVDLALSFTLDFFDEISSSREVRLGNQAFEDLSEFTHSLRTRLSKSEFSRYFENSLQLLDEVFTGINFEGIDQSVFESQGQGGLNGKLSKQGQKLLAFLRKEVRMSFSQYLESSSKTGHQNQGRKLNYCRQYIRDSTDFYLPELALNTLSSYRGYNIIKAQVSGEQQDTAFLQNLKPGNLDAEEDDKIDSTGGDSDEEAEDECHKLLFFWRMNRPPNSSEPLIVNDLYDHNINGCFTKTSEVQWKHFEEVEKDHSMIESNPLEVEDKWGQKVSPNMYIRIKKGGLLTQKKTWTEKPFNRFTCDFWFYPESTDGILFSEASGNFILGFKKLKVFCLLGDTKVKMDKKGCKLVLKKWQHVSVSMNPTKQLLRIYLDSKCVYPEVSQAQPIFDISLNDQKQTDQKKAQSQQLNWDKVSLKSWNKQHLVFFEDFEGAITSVIFWRRIRSHAEIKEFMSSPLSNVDELQSKLQFHFISAPDGNAEKHKPLPSEFDQFKINFNENELRDDSSGQQFGYFGDEEEEEAKPREDDLSSQKKEAVQSSPAKSKDLEKISEDANEGSECGEPRIAKEDYQPRLRNPFDDDDSEDQVENDTIVPEIRRIEHSPKKLAIQESDTQPNNTSEVEQKKDTNLGKNKEVKPEQDVENSQPHEIGPPEAAMSNKQTVSDIGSEKQPSEGEPENSPFTNQGNDEESIENPEVRSIAEKDQDTHSTEKFNEKLIGFADPEDFGTEVDEVWEDPQNNQDPDLNNFDGFGEENFFANDVQENQQDEAFGFGNFGNFGDFGFNQTEDPTQPQSESPITEVFEKQPGEEPSDQENSPILTSKTGECVFETEIEQKSLEGESASNNLPSEPNIPGFEEPHVSHVETESHNEEQGIDTLNQSWIHISKILQMLT